ncbi:hypothetical protein FMEAI12_4230003 [Parafrankia sp. Ea1.12]|nr:hypothetical protein FMEAI12_4230003 [Parafrankia sp. Ea1.12]
MWSSSRPRGRNRTSGGRNGPPMNPGWPVVCRFAAGPLVGGTTSRRATAPPGPRSRPRPTPEQSADGDPNVPLAPRDLPCAVRSPPDLPPVDCTRLFISPYQGVSPPPAKQPGRRHELFAQRANTGKLTFSTSSTLGTRRSRSRPRRPASRAGRPTPGDGPAADSRRPARRRIDGGTPEPAERCRKVHRHYRQIHEGEASGLYRSLQ